MALSKREIGLRIQRARQAAGLTQEDLADRLGIRYGQTVSRYERGESNFGIDRLLAIANETGRPLSYFVSNSVDVSQPSAGALERLAEAASALGGAGEHLGQQLERLETLLTHQDELVVEMTRLAAELQRREAAN